MADSPPEHYYGDLVRKLFMFAAIVMIVGLPFVYELLPVPIYISLFGILALGLFSGLTSPRQHWVIVLNTIIAVSGVVGFETFAVRAYAEKQAFFFVINQLLALIFLFALYYSTKTWRGAKV